MTYFSLLEPQLRLILSGLVFLASLTVLALCLYRYTCTGRVSGSIGDGAVYILLLAFISVSTGLSAPAGQMVYNIRLPWLIFPLVAALVFIYGICGIIREYRKSRSSLSPNSVREAIDGFNFGICFADETGRLVLTNRTMIQLAGILSGCYPQTLEDILHALDAPPQGVEKLGAKPDLYRFPDGKVWDFRSMAIDDAGLEGFTQVDALDVTEIYELNDQLYRDNAQIREAISRMKGMIDRMSELAREQEALDLKIQIHNDIGSSLITLSELAEGSSGADAEKQVQALRKALSYFSRKQDRRDGGIRQLYAFASECGVKLDFSAEMPQNSIAAELVPAAVRECITNCARHGGGNLVKIDTAEAAGVCTVRISNNGKAPDAPVREGGGLSSLRKKVEKAGARMYFEYEPEFVLVLEIKEE